MIYTYICTTCKKDTNIELPLGEDLPKDIKCIHCKKGKMKYDLMGKLKKTKVIIPYMFKAVNEEPYDRMYNEKFLSPHEKTYY